MYYIYKTAMCSWIIRPLKNGWQLEWHFGGGFEISGRYQNPAHAVDDVAAQATGFDDWDLALSIPQEIEDFANWQQVAPRGAP